MSDALRARRYEQVYVVLAAVFIAALVACNLIFKKFFSWEISLPWGGVYAFEQSVGILPYPLTFLVTDILSEVYGRRRANQVVTAGFFASVFVVGLLFVAEAATAADWSAVNDDVFSLVFGTAWAPITASMIAYLTAQYLDIRFFHFWRRLTNGRHLWLRNNASTISSQVVDTVVVLALLASLQAGVTWERLPQLIINGIGFKMLVAFVDTPLFYLAVYGFRRWFPKEMEQAHAAAVPGA